MSFDESAVQQFAASAMSSGAGSHIVKLSLALHHLVEASDPCPGAAPLFQVSPVAFEPGRNPERQGKGEQWGGHSLEVNPTAGAVPGDALCVEGVYYTQREDADGHEDQSGQT